MQTIKTLPKGRHKLSRAQVATSQRTRLLQATVELGVKRGFTSLTLTDLVRRAHVARSTFYEHFADKQQCFLATFDYAADRVLEAVLALQPLRADEMAAPVDAHIARLLQLCLQEPGLVRLVATDAEVLGSEATVRQRAIRNRLADGLVALRDFLRRDDPRLAPISHVRALAIVGAVTEVLQHTFYSSGIAAIPSLQPELSTLVLALLEAPAGASHEAQPRTADGAALPAEPDLSSTAPSARARAARG